MSEYDNRLNQSMECEQLPKLLCTQVKGLVVLSRIVLGSVVLLLDGEIDRLVDVEGDANVLRNMSRILTW